MNLQVNLFVSDTEYNQTPTTWTATTFPSGVRREFARATEALNANRWIRPFNEYYQKIPAIFQHFGATTPPVVIFIDLDTNEVVAALKGAQITERNILDLYHRLSNPKESGDGSGDNGSEWGFLPFGFPGDNDPQNLPALLLVLATIGYTKALDGNTPTKYRIAYGLGAGVTTYFINERFKTILFGKGKTPSWNPIANIVQVGKSLSTIKNYHSLWLVPAAFAGTKAFTKDTPQLLKAPLAIASAVAASVYAGSELKKQGVIKGLPAGKPLKQIGTRRNLDKL